MSMKRYPVISGISLVALIGDSLTPILHWKTVALTNKTVALEVD
jgi:hypothetical protein